MKKPVIAYRIWQLDNSNILRSVYKNDFIWTPGEAAKSNKLPNYYFSEPRLDLSFGIHAFKKMDDLLEYLKYQHLTQAYLLYHIVGLPKLYIIGQVALWGKIVEQESGYRAEFAYPHKLEFTYSHGLHHEYDLKEIENNLRRSYGCEVLDFKFTGNKIYPEESTMGCEFYDATKIEFFRGRILKVDGNNTRMHTENLGKIEKIMPFLYAVERTLSPYIGYFNLFYNGIKRIFRKLCSRD